MPSEPAQRVQMKVHETRKVGKGLEITYANFGHEHVIRSPGAPAEATVGVYDFELACGKARDRVTIFQDRDLPTRPVVWQQFVITLVSVAEGQREVVLTVEVK